MTDKRTNLAASVAARLLNRAKQSGDDYKTLLTSYCFERFLYRLGISGVRDRFVLKGVMLFRVWSEQPYRATRDLDLLHLGDGSFDAIRDDIRTICATTVETDAVVFDADVVQIETIRAEDEYAGIRAILPTRCGTARLTLQIDMGLGDSVWPTPRLSAYPVLLDLPAPEVLVITHAVLKTVAAFLNTEGGDLLIGVADDGSVVGIASDRFASDDEFTRHLAQVVRNGLGDRADTCIDPKTQAVKGKTVCLVSCQRSPEPVFLKWKGVEEHPDGDFYVRSGPGTVKLPPDSAKEYFRTRFPGSSKSLHR